MSVADVNQGNRNQKRLPPRAVEDRERSFPALSIAYRAFAQMEIWCVEGGGSKVDDYCHMFEWHKTPPRPIEGNLNNVRILLRSGATGTTATKDICERFVNYIFSECRTGGTSKIDDPDPHRRFPSLTWLYRYYVIHGNDEAEKASVLKLRDGVLRDLVTSHLIW